MSDVTLAIVGREYKVACAPGEEAHVALLGKLIDSKLSAMPNLSTQPETRRLLYAALLLADELHELKGDRQQDTAEMLEALAERLEETAQDLEGGV